VKGFALAFKGMKDIMHINNILQKLISNNFFMLATS